jgi:hypothetical protein
MAGDGRAATFDGSIDPSGTNTRAQNLFRPTNSQPGRVTAHTVSIRLSRVSRGPGGQAGRSADVRTSRAMLEETDVLIHLEKGV